MLFAASVGCRTPRVLVPSPPVSPAASEALLGAWTLSRGSGFGRGTASFDEALGLARAAGALAPDWVAPERFLDRWAHRSNLTLPSRYAAHLSSAAEGHGRGAYLAARLETSPSRAGMDLATELAPDLSWGWHGLAWKAHQIGQHEEAIGAGRYALALARDASELALFSWALGTYLAANGDRERGLEVLRQALADSGDLRLRAPERAMVGALLARLLLGAEEPTAQGEGVRLAVELITGPWLADRERLDLVEALAEVGQGLVSREEIELALARSADALEGEGRRTAAALLESVRSGSRPPAGRRGWRSRLVSAFTDDAEASATLAVLEDWCADLPEPMRGPDEGPLAPGPRAVVESVRALSAGPPTLEGAREVGQCLLVAGWFAEALGWSGRMAEGDPEGARELEIAALRGRSALAALLNLGRRLDATVAFASAAGMSSKIESTEALHDEVARVLERSGLMEIPKGGVQSPVIGYGPAGSLVHPGPAFSAEDGRLGRGEPGDPVPGLAAAFETMGRFALVGRGAGQGGPDATILRRLGSEVRSGTHLGRPFQGTAVWCQGADVPGRITRRGGAISGAALHEGFYLDLEVVAYERDYWRLLLEGFSTRGGALDQAAVSGALAVPTPSPAASTGLEPALGAADRLRLAVMMDAATGEAAVPAMDAFCGGVVAHEEAHLCDRMAWYPLTTPRVLRLLAFAAGEGFSGARIAEALEERAQLVALAVMEDPRLMWVDLLDAAGRNFGAGGAPHGAAYRRLLGRLVDRMQAESEAGGWADLPGAGSRWIDRLHLASPQDLQALARREARSMGLVR